MEDHQSRLGDVPTLLTDVGEDDSGDAYVIGVRESPEADAWSLLLFECMDEVDPSEKSDGFDTYCLVVDPGQATYYGGVRECEIAGHRLHLVLSEDAASALGIPTNLVFDLHVTNVKLVMLGRGLKRVLNSGRPSEFPGHLAIY